MGAEVLGRLRVALGLLIVFDQDPSGFSWIHFPEVIICEHADLAVENMPSLRYQKMRFFLTWYRGP